MDAPTKPTPEDLPPVLHELVRRLAEAYQPEEIWLFGSWARGEAGPDSDFDLMVIVPDEAEGERSARRAAQAVSRELAVDASILVWHSSAFYRRLEVVMSLPWIVRREGVCLHGQPKPARLGVPRVVVKGA